MLCQLVFQPVIRLIQVAVAIVEYVLIQLCTLISMLVNVVTQALEWVCNTVVQTVCGAVCGLICGICDFFCGIFGCDCGCRNVCNNVCNVVTNVVCGWTWLVRTVLQWVTTLVCNYLLQAIIRIINVIEAIVTMVLTWVCSLIDVVIRWLLCWLYLGDIFDNTEPRRFRVAPKIVRNDRGYSDWFVYVNNPNERGAVDQVQLYILSERGRPLLPVVDRASGGVSYFEVETRGDFITGRLRRVEGRLVDGRPLLYYPYKVMEVASHLFGDIFAKQADDNGRGTDYRRNLFTYDREVQDQLAADDKLGANNYNAWDGKYEMPGGANYFGDGSIPDMGMRVDTDATCSHPTNTFLHLANGQIEYTPTNTDVAETMSCGAGQTLTFDQTNFLMLNKYGDSSAVTTYFVSRFTADDTSVGCNDLLGYTTVTFEGGGGPLFVKNKVLAYAGDRVRMMTNIVENIAPEKNPEIVRVAETYLHECGHQSGLLHDSDNPDCRDDAKLRISKLMDPGGSIRRAFTRIQWCMVRNSAYVTSRPIAPFTQAPELAGQAEELREAAGEPVAMPAASASRAPLRVISENVRQREVRRQLAFNEMNKGALAGKRYLAKRWSSLSAEFAISMLAALAGGFVLSQLVAAGTGVAPIYTLATLGLIYSLEATYHKFRLQKDPAYKVPRCRCAGARRDDTEAVLRDRASSLAGVPTALLGALGYVVLFGLLLSHQAAAIVPLAVGAAVLSGYLGYVMVFRIRALCPTCINISALNLLILAVAV
jgi:uncharacterized membrane protein